MRKVLFVCSMNRWRSPTAEHIFSQYPALECLSAGLNYGADNPLTAELLQWADLIFVMERAHKTKLTKSFGNALKGKRVVCLDIPDNYKYMDPTLISLLRRKVALFLPEVA